MGEQDVDDLRGRGVRAQEVGIGEEEALERGLRVETREDAVLPVADDRGGGERTLSDLRERLLDRGGDLGEAPAFDDAQHDLIPGRLLEKPCEIAWREAGRDLIRARLEHVLLPVLVEHEHKGERRPHDALGLEALRDLAGGLAARDHEGPRLAPHVLGEVDVTGDARRDERAHEILA